MNQEHRIDEHDIRIAELERKVNDLEEKVAAATTTNKIKPIHLNADKVLISGTFSNSLHQP